MSLSTKDAIRRFGLPMITDGKTFVRDGADLVLPAVPGWYLLTLPVHEERKPVADDVQKREVVEWWPGEEGEGQQILAAVPRTPLDRDACDYIRRALLSPDGRILGIDDESFRRAISNAEFSTVAAWVDAVVEEWIAWQKELDAYRTKICPTCGKHSDDNGLPF